MSFFQIAAELGEGMLTTLEIFLLTLLFSLPLGMIISFGRMTKNPVVRIITKIYISIMRGTPLMLQLLIVYFGPYLIFGIRLSASYMFPATIIAFVINYAAYFAEIYRGSIESMEKGQYEAAQVLGLTTTQTFFKVILPQVIKRALPSITNEIITLVKDTSLARVVMVAEILKVAQDYSAKGLIWPLFYTGVFYLIFVGALTLIIGFVE